MRLFIGVELDDRVRAAVARIADRLRDDLKRARVHLDARWVQEPNLHITLWFIGEVKDDRAAAITAAINVPFQTRAFDLTLADCGAFPPAGAPRVLWIAVRAGGDALTALYGAVASRLAPLGFEPERRPYSAHLTIARVKDAPHGSGATVRRVLSDTSADPGTCRIEAVTVFRSHLSPKGSTYESLMRVPLQP